MSVIELKRKARKRFGPQPGFTVDTDWNLVRVGRSPRIGPRTGIGRPFGSGRKIPLVQFWPAHEMASGLLKHEHIKDSIKRNPNLADEISLHLEPTPEREIAKVMGLWNEKADRPSDTYNRYMREHRKHESSNRDVLSS